MYFICLFLYAKEKQKHIYGKICLINYIYINWTELTMTNCIDNCW